MPIVLPPYDASLVPDLFTVRNEIALAHAAGFTTVSNEYELSSGFPQGNYILSDSQEIVAWNGGGVFARKPYVPSSPLRTTTLTVGEIPAGATGTVVFNLAATPAGIRKITVSQAPCRVAVYATYSDLSGDADRLLRKPDTTPASSNIAQYGFTPEVMSVSGEMWGVNSTITYIAVRNDDTAPQTYTVQITLEDL